jgi:hypothetical protein
MKRERIGPYDGGWRLARKPFRCGHWTGLPGGRCARVVPEGALYYDTCEGEGLASFWRTIRFCVPCAESSRYPHQITESAVEKDETLS